VAAQYGATAPAASEALQRWTGFLRRGEIDAPRFILHVDEHHDMLGEHHPVNFGNFLYFAMRRWPACRAHWLVSKPIDSPDVWLSERAWSGVADRFSSGGRIPRGWPRPDPVSVCTSPGFTGRALRRRLVGRISSFAENQWMAELRAS